MSFHFTLILIRLLIVLLGAVVVYLSFKSYMKNRSSAMLLLSIGFGIITISVVIEGMLFEFFGLDIFAAHMVESVGVALGFAVIIYSIYGTKT